MTSGGFKQTEQSHSGESPVVLVVDDETDLVELLQARLSRRGFKVLCAHTRGGADGHLSQTSPALIICDLHLGPESGIDVYRDCRLRGLQTPFVFLSGAESFDVFKMAVGDDMLCQFIHKPVDFNELLEIVRNMLEAS